MARFAPPPMDSSWYEHRQTLVAESRALIAAGALQMPVVTRFAPSPNGALHLGHALSALCAKQMAVDLGGHYLVRIEDIDAGRSRPEHVQGILDDLGWLGLLGEGPPLYQSTRLAAYQAAFEQLQARGLLYPCFCSRGDIAAALKIQAVRHGPDGPHYPGTCRALSAKERAARMAGKAHGWRLDMARALTEVDTALDWHELGEGIVPADPGQFGDVVLMRKDAPASYHLACTLDDAFQNVTLVVRGRDLYAYTALHRLLQHLLGLPAPVYWHHPLLLDEAGEKLAKSRRSPALATLRAAGQNPHEVLAALQKGQLPTGILLDLP